MKRLIWLLLVLIVAFVAAERIPAIRARAPWLPTVPGLTVTADKSGEAADAEGGSGRKHGGGGRRGAPDGPIPVLAATVEIADVPVTAEVLGTIQATNNVTVKSQVDGKLTALDFADGQDVKKGDILARIEPAMFQASYDQAVAKKAQDQANLANAQTDLTRYAKLAATQYGSAQQADTQKAQVAQLQAQLLQDQAAIDTAKTTLDYATIRAPIDGRTGIRLVDTGNILHAADTTGIVTIAQVQPIAAVFNLPQQLLGQINAAQAKGSLKLDAFNPETHKVIDTGTLQVIDNTVDQTTGTVKLKGSFPNLDLQLWPGQFVNLRLTIAVDKGMMVVPTPAVQRGPDGAFMFVLGPDDAVHMKKVTVGRQTEDRSVIMSGVAPSEMVVTTGFTRLTDGAKVAVAKAGVDDGSAAKASSDVTKPPGQASETPSPTDQAKPSGDGSDDQKKHHRRRKDGGQAQNSDHETAKPD